MTQVQSKGKLVDASTGEVIEDVNEVRDLILVEREDPIAELIRNSGAVPIHVAKAKELKIPAPVVSSYVGRAADSVKQHLNEKIMLTGAIVYFSGRFTPKDPSTTDGSGFYTFLMKTDILRPFEYRIGKEIHETSVPVVIKCDGVKVRDTMINLIDTWGWYDWEVKIPVVFSLVDGSFYMEILPE